MPTPNERADERLAQQSDPMTSEEIQAGADAGLTGNLESQRTREDTPARTQPTDRSEVEASKRQQSERSQSAPSAQNQSTSLSGASSSTGENPRLVEQTSDRSGTDVPIIEGGKGTTADITAGEQARVEEELRSQIPTQERGEDESNSNFAYQDPKRAQGDKA